MRYHTILFDADNTLLDFNRSERVAIKEALHGIGVEADEEMVKTYSRINLKAWKRLERGEITKNELRVVRFSEFCAHYGIETDVTALAYSYTDHLAKQSFLIEGAVELCQALAPHCTLYIITNGIYSVQAGRFDSSPLAPLFTDVFVSECMGAEKPSRIFFEEVSKRIENFDPAKTLVVGDSLTSDIKGGHDFGLDTCWFHKKEDPVPEEAGITYSVTALADIVPIVLS